MAKKGGLGKGLDALFADTQGIDEADGGTRTSLKIGEIEPNKNQPRKDFDAQALSDLADSIRAHGMLQPIIVRSTNTGMYQIIAGERRWRAARIAELSEVPVIIKEMSEKQVMEVALIENLQREDLNPVEEALGYKTLMEQYDLTQEEVSKRVSKSRPAVANAVRLLQLPEKALELLREGRISSGHAKALLMIADPEKAAAIAGEIVEKNLTVRDVERLGKESKPRQSQHKHRDPYFDEVEIAIKNALGRQVKIKEQGTRGYLELEFIDQADLADLAKKLAGNEIE